MNKKLYRLVFNARRGQMMAVAETAGAQGKSASGETTANTNTNSASNVPPAQQGCAQAAIKVIAVSMLNLARLAPVSAQAQVRADAITPGNQQPQIVTTANNVTRVNIQAPSAAGVSRNVYSQFDVNAQGAILNNSRTNVQTQLGGWVQSNGNLAGGAARVILNEVNSSNPSQLKGFVEVAGQRAEVTRDEQMKGEALFKGNCPGCWVATAEDGRVITYRPAGNASKTADNTATVEVNYKKVDGNVLNGGETLKLKFPGQP